MNSLELLELTSTPLLRTAVRSFEVNIDLKLVKYQFEGPTGIQYKTQVRLDDRLPGQIIWLDLGEIEVSDLADMEFEIKTAIGLQEGEEE